MINTKYAHGMKTRLFWHEDKVNDLKASNQLQQFDYSIESDLQ